MTVTDIGAHHDTPRPADGTAGGGHRGVPDRWQPTRAGLVNVWQYYEETFEFEKGRLVLFGPNGSGKTMALELLYPYLLDANASPSRLSTAGGNERGGLWSRVAGYEEGTSRVGYLWMEFGRRHRDGHSEHFTCGTRLAASPGGGGSHCWFTTRQRVGDGLRLLNDDRVALTPQALRDAVVPAGGTVWGADTAGYRDAVRSTLYADFTLEGYQALIDGLLAVRKQSITDGLTPRRLHELLTDGLPGLDPRELDYVARGFEHLDSRRDTIAELEDVVAACNDVARRNRSYARAALRYVADHVTSAQTALDTITRRRNAAAKELAEAETALEAAETEKSDVDGTIETLAARADAVKESAGYQSLSDIEGQRTIAENAEVAAGDAEEILEQRNLDRDDAAGVAREAADQAAADEHAVTDAVRALGVSAREAGIDVPAVPDDPAAYARRHHDEVEAREHAVAEVRKRLAAHDKAVSERDQAALAVEEAETVRDKRAETLRSTEAALDTVATSWADAILTWARTVVELDDVDDDVAPIVDDVARCAADVDVDVFADVVTDRFDRATQSLVAASTLAAGRVDELEAEHRETVAERDALASQDRATGPAPAPWRIPRDVAVPGAALWELVDAHVDVDPADLDGIEAALDGAGILDAWVHPDGTVPALGDIVAAPGAEVDGNDLTSILHVDANAAIDADVDPDVVTAILASVGFHDATCTASVASDGRFRYGPVTGVAPVRPARHIGAAARERARQEELAALAERIAELETAVAAAHADVEHLAARKRSATAERASAPRSAPLVEARQAVDLAEQRVEDADEALERARGRYEDADRAAIATLAALTRAASTNNLPTTTDDLDKVVRALRLIRSAASDVINTTATAKRARNLAGERAKFAASRSADAERAEQTATQARSRAKTAKERYEQLERSVGADARAAAAELEKITKKRSYAQGRAKQLAAAIRTLDGEHASARTTLSRAEEEAEAAGAARDESTVWFVAAIDAGLDADAGADIGDEDLTTVSGVRQAVRAVNRAITATADVQRVSRELNALNEVRTSTQRILAGRAELSVNDVEPATDVHLVLAVSRLVAVVDGVDVRADTMVERFDAELALAKGELADAEAELFEEIFAGSLRTHLASRLRASQQLVDSMNDLLADIRSASGGVAVSLRWDVDDDVEDQKTLTRIKSILLRDHHSEADRETLHRFLSRRIEQVRLDDRSTLSWRDALEALFDYRQWHTFRIMVRHDRFGDRAVAFTSRKVSLSAGEKALVLSLPLFAAVASHYMPRDSAGTPRTCPRLLLLDEVFPKNDRANKRQILGLLTELDLDCVLTSDKDRCDYDTVDGIAIAVIAKAGDMSYSTRLVWNGHILTEAAPADPSADGTQEP